MKNNFENLKRLGIAAVISATSFVGQAQDKHLKKSEQISISKENKKDTLYPKEFYTPESKEYNPLKVYKDFSPMLQKDTTNFEKSDHHMSSRLAKEIIALDAQKPVIKPEEYISKDSFTTDYISKMKAWLLSDNIQRKFNLKNTYFKGKADYYEPILDKYRDHFTLFKHNKPEEARYDENDWGIKYGGRGLDKEYDFNDVENYKDAIEIWQQYIDDVDTSSVYSEKEDRVYGRNVWDVKYDIEALEEDAVDEWDRVYNKSELEKRQHEKIIKAEEELQKQLEFEKNKKSFIIS